MWEISSKIEDNKYEEFKIYDFYYLFIFFILKICQLLYYVEYSSTS